MPELPEVETVRKGLEHQLKEFLIHRIEVLTERSISSEGGSEVFTEKIIGLEAGEWLRRGKYLICKLYLPRNRTFAGWWVIHLRMTGYLQWFKKEHPICPHTRIRIWNKEGSEIRFVDMRNFGQMWWVPPECIPEEKIHGLSKLGPEPFSKEFNSLYLENSLRERKRSIKASLLDQSIIAGVGNIYADESLFEARIIPTRESRTLSRLEISKLSACLKKVLKTSIGKGGTTFKDFRDLKGLNGNYGEQASVYRRQKKPCRNCGELIVKTKVCGRGTLWCPKCQK